MNKGNIVIIQKSLPHYRVPFFNALKNKLEQDGFHLQLIYGKEQGKASLKKDESVLSWAEYLPVKLFKLGKIEFIWHGNNGLLKNADLIIVENANKLLFNYYLLLCRRFYSFKLAFWGHGINRQGGEKSVGNKLKHLLIKTPDWWFAYTKGVSDLLIQHGFPPDKITTVVNAIDTLALRKNLENVNPLQISKLKHTLGLKDGYTGIFIGGMYPEKRLAFLIESCKMIRQKVSDFHMLFIGDGEDAFIVKKAAQAYSWIHYLGPAKGIEKAAYLDLADVLLMPGLVGLVVLDSFAAQVPLVTTHIAIHSPEIEYLTHNENGIITENSVEAYATVIINLFSDKKLLNHLKKGCKEAKDLYTIEKMATNFSTGIKKSLEN